MERRGTELHQGWGRRDRRDREESVEPHPSAGAAQERLRAIVEEKREEGYERLADSAEVQDRVESLLGVTFACSAPPIIAEADDPAEDVSDTYRLRPRDVLIGVGVMGGSSYVHVSTLEELAAALARRGDHSTAYVWFERPASGTTTSINATLK